MPRIRPFLRTKRKVELRNLSQVEAERIRGELQTFPAATQPADLISANAYADIGTQIDTAIAAIGSIVVLKGTWDASSGSFPGSGATSSGWSYIVSIGGTVDGIPFVSGDRIIAIVDDASTTTYSSNWLKLDYSDLVSSVAGRTGAVELTSSDISDFNSASNSLADARITSATGVSVQAYAANLTAWAALATSSKQATITADAGWSVPTGTATKAGFDTATVTTQELAEHVKALVDALTAQGLLST